jgi:hypothetical protein
VSAPQTRWRLRRTALVDGLDVQVVVDTTAVLVVGAIEEAARRHGIELERLRGCGHDGWQAGCPECEREAELAGELIERAERR